MKIIAICILACSALVSGCCHDVKCGANVTEAGCNGKVCIE